MAESQQDEQFVQRLEYVLQFLSDHGFDKAATAVYEQLERKAEEPDAAAGLGEVDDVEPSQSAAEYDAEDSGQVQEYRSASADHVLGSVGLSHTEAEDAEDSQSHCRWPPGAAEALQTRLSGSSRLYEDPDLDEYSSMDDMGYIRRSITHQQDFVVSELDFLRTNDDECYFHEGSLQHGGDSSLLRADSCSNSSSASLSSPGMSTSAQHAEVSSSQQQQRDEVQGEPGSHQGKAKATGDAAWDSGPAGITFAEPVTTPTKDSQRSSISDLKPSLSRVESLSNSFIEDLESIDGAAGGAADGTSRHDSEAGSIAGDLGTPPRRSRAEGSDPSDALGAAADAATDVIDLSPPSPPPDCAADAGFDLSNIFELGLRASSRTSSVDVLQGSVRCWSEADSDLFGQQQQLDTGRGWASQSAGNSACGSAASSRAGSSLGLASLAGPGGLVIKPRQSAGASRLQSSSHHDPEQDTVTVDLQRQQQQQAAQQQQQPEQQAAAAQPEQPAASTQQQPEPQQQQQGQQQPQVQPPQQQEQEPVLILSPTSDPQQDKAAAAAASQQQQQQQRHQGGSDSGSSSSAAGPVTPTALTASVSTQQQAAAADGSAAAAAAAAPGAEPVVEASTDSVAAISPAAAEPAAAATDSPAAAAAEGPAAAEARCGSSSPASPPAAAAGGGFGFTFPTTPPSAVDAAVHEERAERVFSTWASNHSRSLSDALDMECAAAAAAGGEDAEADTSSSQPPPDSPAADGSATAATAATADSAGPWVFPALDLVAAAAAAGEPSTSDAAAAAAAGSSSCRSDNAGQITVVAPVSPYGESPFLAGSALAACCSKNSSPAGQALSRGGSRAHSSSSAAARAATAGDSSRSSSRRLSAAGRQQQQQAAAAAAATNSSGRGVRSTLGDGVQASPGSGGALSSGLLQQQASAGYDALGNALIPALDADAESTGGFSGSGELSAPRYVVDEAGNLLYEYDTAYIENRYEMFDLRVIHRRRRTGFEDSKEFPIRKNDLIAGRYQVMDFLGSAAFSQAVQALDVATGALVCLKIIKNNKDYFDQSLDEIKLLRYVNNSDPEDEHHIVRLYDFFYYKEHLILVCELLRANLYEFQKYQRENGDDPYFTLPRIQRIAIQVLQSLGFLHSLGLVHSDLKPENILIKSYSRCEVKVIDLGSSCFITDHLSSYVQSRSYRAPEVILGLPYGQKIDIWSLGCILAELATGYVLFQNDSLATLLARLEGILGPLPGWMVAQGRYSNRYYTRSRQLYERSKGSGRYELLLPKQTSLRHRVPSADEGFLDFLSYLLTPDPTARPGATEALQHPWLSYPFPPVEQIPD